MMIRLPHYDVNHSREARGAGKLLGAQLGLVKVRSGPWREFEGQDACATGMRAEASVSDAHFPGGMAWDQENAQAGSGGLRFNGGGL